jgi:hypothetical protein
MTVTIRVPVDLVRVRRDPSQWHIALSSISEPTPHPKGVSSSSPLLRRHVDHSASYIERVYVNLANSATNWPVTEQAQLSSIALAASSEMKPHSTPCSTVSTADTFSITIIDCCNRRSNANVHGGDSCITAIIGTVSCNVRR